MMRAPNVKDYTCGYRCYTYDAVDKAIGIYGYDFIKENSFACMIEVLYKNAVSNDADIARCGRCTYFENIKLDSYNSSYYNEDKKIIIIKKISKTPGKYPRNAGTPAKKPL